MSQVGDARNCTAEARYHGHSGGVDLSKESYDNQFVSQSSDKSLLSCNIAGEISGRHR
jgi:hypothetical protein